MKKHLLIIAFILFSLVSIAQNDSLKITESYIIYDAVNNDDNITEHLVEAGAFTVFYENIVSKNLYMANIWYKANSKSFGRIYELKSNSLEQTSQEFKKEFITFLWDYANDYDDQSGTAKVELVKIYYPKGILIRLEISPENSPKLTYKGYMEYK